tara:strand:+ start:311 stop:478 length:168 start_codon:yes stop_codon:yes gene_type:complete
MNNKKSPESHQDFTAFNLTFNQTVIAKNLILHFNKDLEGETEEKFKKIQGWRLGQ